MSENNDQTNPGPPEFDFSKYPLDTLFYDRRTGRDRRGKTTDDAPPATPRERDGSAERRVKKDRRRRIDPTTFEKQYTDDEMEFMNAMQRFKEMSGKSFPSYREVIKVIVALGYRRAIFEPDPAEGTTDFDDSALLEESTIDA